MISKLNQNMGILWLCMCVIDVYIDNQKKWKTANINIKNTVYTHINGKIAHLKQQISEMRYMMLCCMFSSIGNVHYN